MRGNARSLERPPWVQAGSSNFPLVAMEGSDESALGLFCSTFTAEAVKVFLF